MRGAKWGALLICISFVVSAIPLTSSIHAGGAASASPAPTTREEKVLRVAMQDDIKTLNPLVSSDVWTANVLNWLWDSPMYTDPETDKLVPYLANGTTNMTADSCFNFDDIATLEPGELAKSPVGKVCTVWYNLTGARWHDGLEIDAEDLLFSFYVAAALPAFSYNLACLKDRGGGTESNYSNDHYLFINPVDPDPSDKIVGLRFYLQADWSKFISDTLAVLLLPTHIWSSTVSGQIADDVRPWHPKGHVAEWNSTIALNWDCMVNGIPRVIGNGPFKFDYWEKGQRIKITTWREHFYDKQPIIDSVLYLIYATAEQAVLALKDDEVDYIAWSMPPSYIGDLQQDENVGLSVATEKGFFYMCYNMRRESFGYDTSGVDRGLALRRAIAHCVDKQYLVERILQNYGLVADGPISPLDVDWYNESIVKYPFDLGAAKEMLHDAGYVEPDWNNPATLGTKDNCWKNPDGTNIGSYSDGKIRILAPQGGYDGRQYAWIMVANNLKKIGLYAEIVPMDFGSIVEKANAHDFDIYILGWRIGSEPTDYLWDFFHSAGTQNFPGYCNASFDRIIDEARNTSDSDIRHARVKEAASVIAIDQPYHALYFRKNIEAYRADNFVGWKVGSFGTILCWQSLLEIHPPYTQRLRMQISAESAVVSNGTMPVTIQVRDQDRTPVAGAVVVMNLTEGSLSTKTGLTDLNGYLTVHYTAPYVSANATIKECSISVESASKDGYDPAPGTIYEITVIRADIDFLTLRIELDSDVIDSGESTTFTIIVRNGRYANRPPVEGAKITADGTGNSNVIPKTATTDAEGKAAFVFTAPEVDDSTIFDITIEADMEHYISSSRDIQINVLWVEDGLPPPPPPMNPYVIILVAVITVLVIAAIYSNTRAPRPPKSS